MARSTYIYLIIDPAETGVDAVLAGFTVKHEMESELARLDGSRVLTMRVRDRPRGDERSSLLPYTKSAVVAL